MSPSRRRFLAAAGLLSTGALLDAARERSIFVKDARAVVGMPATPGSVAGVARRTTRRTIRRSTIYAASLPPNCRVVVVEGVSLHQCGSTYYQPYQGQYVVVYVD